MAGFPILFATVTLAALAGGTPCVEEGEFEIERAALTSELVDELAALASWCHENKLYLARDETWAQVIEFAPDHPEARKALGYKKAKDGGWEEPKRRRPPKNHNKKALEELPGQRSTVFLAHGDRLLALVDAHGDELEAGGREAVFAEIVALAPDHAPTRERRGDVSVEGTWMMRETAVAKRRRPWMKAQVRKAFQDAPAHSVSKPTGDEKKLGPAWTTALEGEGLRVLTSGEAQEAERAWKSLWVARQAFRKVFELETAGYHEDLRAFLLADPGETDGFLANYPALAPKYREFLSTLRGSGIEGTGDFAHWGESVAHRRDAAVRHGIGWMLQVEFDIGTSKGWAFEGIGLYLTRSVVGTRLNWFVQSSRYLPTAEDVELRGRLMDPETNWINEAYVFLRNPEHPPIASFLKKTVNQLNTEDLLASYALTAYLLEGRPGDAGAFLRALGAGVPAEVASQQALGLSLTQLDGRVRAWLGERR